MKKLLCALMIFVVGLLQAETVKVIVPYAAGTNTDVLSRVLADSLNKKLKQHQAVVQNKPGAGGDIATRILATEDPNSISLLVNTAAGVALGSILSTSDYDYDNLVPLVRVGDSPQVFVASSKSDIRTFNDVLMRKSTTYGSGGAFTRVLGEMIAAETGKNMIGVPYSGVSQSLTDLLSGQLESGFLYPNNAKVYIENKQIIPLAVTASKRVEQLPDVPTFAELGIKDMATVNYVVVVNKTTKTKDLVEIKQALQETLQEAEVKQKLNGLGIVLSASSNVSSTYLDDERKKYIKLLKKFNIKE